MFTCFGKCSLLQATAKELAESVDLLLQLKEPQRTLCNEFLTHAESRLSEKLTELGEASCQVRYTQCY